MQPELHTSFGCSPRQRLQPPAAPAAAPLPAGVTPKRLSDTGLKRETYRAATAMECLVRQEGGGMAAASAPVLHATLQLSSLRPVGRNHHTWCWQPAAASWPPTAMSTHAKPGALAISAFPHLPPINALHRRRATCTCLTPSGCTP